MTRVEIFETSEQGSVAAGESLGREIAEQFGDGAPDAVLLFASPVYEPQPLLRALDDACGPAVLAGCSSAGEFTFRGPLSTSAVALAIQSDSMRFKVHVTTNLNGRIEEATRELARSLDVGHDAVLTHKTVMMLMDTLAGHGEAFLDAFTENTDGAYQVFGGGAADDAAFKETRVFAGREAFTDAAIALEIRSREPVGIGVSHGWTPATHAMTVTEAAGLRLVSIDGRPAADVVEEVARDLGRPFDREAPMPFFLHHVIGFANGDQYKLRVPLSVDPDGALVCAAEVPDGATIRVMRTRNTSAAEAARVAAGRAWQGLDGRKPAAAIFFDCASTRLRLGDDFGSSVNEIMDVLGSGTCVGCNTYGQFARRDGQFGGFHNCTAVVCVLPE